MTNRLPPIIRISSLPVLLPPVLLAKEGRLPYTATSTGMKVTSVPTVPRITGLLRTALVFNHMRKGSARKIVTLTLTRWPGRLMESGRPSLLETPVARVRLKKVYLSPTFPLLPGANRRVPCPPIILKVSLFRRVNRRSSGPH